MRFIALFLASFALLATGYAEVPEECIIVGSELLTTCSYEVSVSTEYFGVDVNDVEGLSKLKIEDSELEGLLEEIGEPSPSCCMGTCQFANAKCGCNDEMVEIINSFIGGNFKFYRSVSEAIGKLCKTPVFYQEECPKKWQRKWKKFTPTDCTRFV